MGSPQMARAEWQLQKAQKAAQRLVAQGQVAKHFSSARSYKAAKIPAEALIRSQGHPDIPPSCRDRDWTKAELGVRSRSHQLPLL